MNTGKAEHAYERILSVSAEDLQLELRGHSAVAWAEFLLNPRRLRGSDFLMRWSQGVWSEERVVEAVNATAKYFALPYGPSSTAPDNDVREFELYFERLEQANLGDMKLKRPDLLIFKKSDQKAAEEIVQRHGGLQELPFTPESDMQDLLSLSLIAVECENSLWVASQMPSYNSPMRPQKRLGGQLGYSKSAVLPTIIVKKEDRAPLRDWQAQQKVPIHIWHVFFDLAFGLALDDAEQLVEQGLIQPTVQVFQAPGGAVTRKSLYKIYYN